MNGVEGNQTSYHGRTVVDHRSNYNNPTSTLKLNLFLHGMNHNARLGDSMSYYGESVQYLPMCVMLTMTYYEDPDSSQSSLLDPLRRSKSYDADRQAYRMSDSNLIISLI